MDSRTAASRSRRSRSATSFPSRAANAARRSRSRRYASSVLTAIRRSTSRCRRYVVIDAGAVTSTLRDCSPCVAARRRFRVGYGVTHGTSRSTMPYHSKWQHLPTEAINPDTLAIDKMAVKDIVDLVTNEDRRVVTAVHRERESIAHGVEILTQALKKGGRIFLVGAGTSGRLGVVEAAEMPPTFGTPPELVQAIM